MTTILYEGTLDNVDGFEDAYSTLIYSMESGDVDKCLVGVDLWKKLKNSRVCNQLRHEVKLPYLITNGTTTFTASLVIVTKHCYMDYGEYAIIRRIGCEPPQLKMTLENMQSVSKVVNIQQGWLQRRLFELIEDFFTT